MKYFSIIFLSFSIFVLEINGKDNTFTVVLDAGHGGHDSGAVGYEQMKEKEITLNIVLAVKTLIHAYDNEISVILTRDKDIYRTLEERALISNYFKPDLFLSVHCDGSRNTSAKGASVYLQKNVKHKPYTEENYKKSAYFALILNDILIKDLSMKSRNILFNNYSVLRNTLEYSPSVLVETGFISNKDEAVYFREKGQKALSYAILKAILKYKSMLYEKQL